MRPGQASQDESTATQGERRGGEGGLHKRPAPGAAFCPTLEAFPGRNYDPISILKTGIFLTFRPLLNAIQIGGYIEQSLQYVEGKGVIKISV